jgi:hypothetical protein
MPGAAELGSGSCCWWCIRRCVAAPIFQRGVWRCRCAAAAKDERRLHPKGAPQGEATTTATLCKWMCSSRMHSCGVHGGAQVGPGASAAVVVVVQLENVPGWPVCT